MMTMRSLMISQAHIPVANFYGRHRDIIRSHQSMATVCIRSPEREDCMPELILPCHPDAGSMQRQMVSLRFLLIAAVQVIM